MQRLMIGLWLAIASGTPVQACDPSDGPPLSGSSPEFEEAVSAYYNDGFPTPLKLAAYATLLRTNEPIFSAMVREGKASDIADIRHAAIYCELMRAHGFVASVSGLSEATANLTEPQQQQVLTFTFTMPAQIRDFSAGCVTTTKAHKGAGCDPKYFVSFADGAINFRWDYQTGSFRWEEGAYRGVINLVYGGPTYEVPATLVLQ